MKKRILGLFIMLASGAAFFSSCKKDSNPVPNPPNVNESELITTVKLTFTDLTGANDTTFIYKDIDGDGGSLPTKFDTIRLAAHSEYFLTVLLLNESKNPVDTISNEVAEEAEEHQFFFVPTQGASMSFMYQDEDDNEVPIGLLTMWHTGAATTTKAEKLKVILKHQGEEKPKSGTGNIAIGETDIELSFPVVIK